MSYTPCRACGSPLQGYEGSPCTNPECDHYPETIASGKWLTEWGPNPAARHGDRPTLRQAFKGIHPYRSRRSLYLAGEQRRAAA